jgi:class 3 adenylate cyclase/YHS domain-containing protein
MPISEQRARIQRAIAFVDLAGFTALTEEHGDEDAARLATRFAELTRAQLGPGDHLVKTLGDAVLVTSVTAVDGVRFVERLITHATGLPALRAGLHFGNVVERDGDVFGAAVNLAARVAAEAHPGEVLGTEPIAAAAGHCGIAVIELGKVALKNVSQPVTLHSLALVLGASDTPIDPVCHVPIDRRNAAGQLRHQDAEYWFCSLTCAAAFASNPSWHIAPRKKSA